jgi:hypothetical protein
MKIVASVLMLAVMGGAASAAHFMPLPRAGPPDAKPEKISGVLHPAGVSEAVRSPVPLVRLPKVRSDEIASPTEPPGELPPVREPPAASRHVTESSARAAIERDGYKSVSGLTCNAGRCTGRALRGQTEISIMVEPDGGVRAN